MKKIVIIICLLFSGILNAFSQSDQDQLREYLRNFQYQKALDYIEMQEPTKDLFIQKALCYKALGNYQKSLEILYPLSKEYNGDLQIITEMAVCYEALSQRDSGIDCYNELIRLDSANVYFKMQKADLLYQQGKYRQSLELFRHINEDHGMTNALKRVGQCYEKLNLPDSALLYFKEAWEINPYDGFSAASFVNLCLKTQRTPEAVAYSDKYMETDTTNHQMNLLNALSYYSINDFESAISKFEGCINRGDSSLIVNRSLGLSYYSIGESEKAYPYLDRAFAQDTTNNNVLYCLAVTCNDEAKYDDAAFYFQKLLDRTIPPDMALYLYYRGMAIAYERNMKNQEAVDSYLLALNYAKGNQKMHLYYTIAQLYELFLREDADALVYYKLYNTSLTEYYEDLKVKADTEPMEIEETKMKLDNLDGYIKRLEKRITKKAF
ncbi:tetratricopeptide repeat protein [Prevotella sp. 10(H)]|uniref:tetratricopeptide repeat protein n=1 Tax=Prevotella sp. 10(H) TaxID=1158294 RepID=UPI0004A7119F|nr:tetratricopeptide repeat protein [Prevotella sp. 10(H)]